MAKRRAVAVDSDEDIAQTPPSAQKRARTENSDEEVQEVAPLSASRRDVKGKGKAVENNAENEGVDIDLSDDEEDEMPQAQETTFEDDEKFEEEHEDAVRAAIEAKRKVQGGIAEHGIVEAIELHQFMCHKFLTFTFGPQINFIIGHNGSGKSAVLTAITVALGGKAASTGRGSGLKSFIREGQNVAEVTIAIKNHGEEAYRPKDYGSSIVITRKFTKDGLSSWKIKAKSGKVISTKREELSAICDHMNIQVDNPLNVLTQDAARQFLSASNPAEKYKLFLRGTQLTQLSEEYDVLQGNINQTARVLQQKKQVLPDLRAAFKEATLRFEEASKAREQRKKVDELKKELAWAHVATKEEEMRKKFEELAKMSHRLPRIQESIDEADAKVTKTNQDVATHETELLNLGNIEDLHAKRKKLSEESRANKNKLIDFKNEEKQMNDGLRGVNTQLEEYNKRIAEETKRMEIHTQAKREETMRKLQLAKVEADEAHNQVTKVTERAAAQKAENDRIKQEGEKFEASVSQTQRRIVEINEMIKQCKQQQQNALTPYGNNIRELVSQIAKAKWHGEKPIGPLGLHVKVKQSHRWAADVLRSQLAQFLTAFAVTDPRDRPQLKHLLDRSKNPHLLIIISQRDIFDYHAGEPPPEKLTVLRVLEISDEYVLRILINQASIERNIIAKTRREAEDTLASLRGGTAFTADGFRWIKFFDGGGSSVKLQFLNRGDPRNLLFTGSDAEGSIQHYESQLRAAEQELQVAKTTFEELKWSYNNGRRTLDEINAEGKRADAHFQQARRNHAALQEEANEELPAGIVGLEAAKTEALKEKESLMAQFEEVAKQKARVDEVQKVVVTELNKSKAQIEEFEERRSTVARKVEEAAAQRAQAQSDKAHWERKLADENDKVKKVEDTAKILEEEFKAWTAKASEYCEVFNNPRKVAEVQRNLASVQAALKEREKTHGATVEEMVIEVNKTQANLKSAEKDLNSLSSLNKALKVSHQTRIARWQEFRRHIALRCKVVFMFLLSHRGYYGKVLFDHQAQTLQLRVQTDDQAGTQAREKDARSLSGGEKSFSTICLLLSLWEAIGCPLRCLDEFDVFMDAVNRRISMKMMIETANKSDKKQYILITPQDMNSVHIGQTVRVHRMHDPERGQAVLNFG